ncbi:MAG: nitronate monooxygenase [Eubacterium sp.]
MLLINQLLNIKYPIFQGAMANIATPEFAAVASNAGCLGIIATGSMDAEQARAAVRRCRALTDKPFGVNVMLMNPESDAIMAMLIEEKVAAVTTGAGNPGKYLVPLKEAGIKIFPVVASVALAKRLARDGADGIIAEGTESGGHIGDIATMALVPQIVEAVEVPVIAAGGIATGKQFNAALCLGAEGVQIGTCLLLSDECPIHENYKKAVIKAKDRDTVVTGRSLNAPVRVMKNPMTTAYLKMEQEGVGREEMELLTLGSLRKAVVEGDIKNGSLMMGQVAGLCRETKPFSSIIEGLLMEAAEEKLLFEKKSRELSND